MKSEMSKTFPFCRLCETKYSKNTSRSNLFENSKDRNATLWVEILKQIGIVVVRRDGFSESICKPCQTLALKAQKSLSVIANWNEKLKSETTSDNYSKKKT